MDSSEYNNRTRSYDVKYVSPKYLDAPEKLLLMILLSMRNLKEIHISVEALAEQSSLSSATVKRKLKSLADKGFISRKHRGVKKRTITEVHDHILANAMKRSYPDMYLRLKKKEIMMEELSNYASLIDSINPELKPTNPIKDLEEAGLKMKAPF